VTDGIKEHLIFLKINPVMSIWKHRCWKRETVCSFQRNIGKGWVVGENPCKSASFGCKCATL